MRHNISRVWALLLAVLAAGCAENGADGMPDTGGAIVVSTTVESFDGDLASRGTPISSQAEMVDLALYCTYTGGSDWAESATLNKMANVRMIKSGEAEGDRDYWTYASGDPVRWETGPSTTANDRYTFFAYAPYGVAASNGVSAVAANDVANILGKPRGLPYIKYVVPSTAAAQPDLMVAVRRENIRPTGNPVALTMNHALTAVGFKVVGDGEQIASIEVTGFSDKGLIALDGNNIEWDLTWLAPNGSLLSSPSATAPLTANWFAAGIASGAAASTTGEVMADDGWLMMIPQTLGEDAKVRVTFSDGTSELVLSLDGKVWQAGKRVTYTIKIPVVITPSPGEVNVNGVIWAGSNVAAPGVFAPTAAMYDGANQYTFDQVAANANKGVCPAGWRTPSQPEVQALVAALTTTPPAWQTNYQGSGIMGREFVTSGGTLFFSASGHSGGLSSGVYGYYRTYTVPAAGVSGMLSFDQNTYSADAVGSQTYLYSVRCVRTAQP